MSLPSDHGSCHCGRPLDRHGAESMSETAGLCPACRADRLAAMAEANRETRGGKPAHP